MIRLVGSDIGGTLTNKDGQITPFTATVLRQLPVPLCLVTGFNRHVAFRYLEGLQHPDPYLIAQNGAFAYHRDTLLFERLLPSQVVPDLVAFLLSHGCVARIFCTDNQVYCMVPDGYRRRIRRWDDPIYRIHEGSLSDIPSPVIQVCAFEPAADIQRILPEAQRRFHEMCIEGSLLYGTHQWLEFNHPRARKETAFLDFLALQGVSPDEAMFCGDNFNDEGVLRSVGWPVVVGDAPEPIRKLARTVTAPGYQDGIARFLAATFGIDEVRSERET